MPQDIAVELDDWVIEALQSMAQHDGVSVGDLAKRIFEDAAHTECPSTATENAQTE